MENEMKKPPVKIFRCGAIQAAIWLHPTGIGGAIVDIPSVRISKSYRDKGTGDWLNTDFLRADDLPKVSLVATEAFKYLRMRAFEPGTTQNGSYDDALHEQTDDFPAG